MPLPPLPFGEADAISTSDPAEASDILDDVVPTLRLEPLSQEKIFRIKIAVSKVGDLPMLAYSCDPSRINVERAEGWHLILPTLGRATLRCQGRNHELQSGADAILLPNLSRRIESCGGSGVNVAFEAGRLGQTLAMITGKSRDSCVLPDQPIVLSLAKSRSLFPGFLNICSLIDVTRGQGDMDKMLGIEDMFYRWLAIAVAPELDGVSAEPTVSQASELDTVCDLIRSRPERPLTLTEMEAASGLSARSLQYAFKARFGCAPMEWQRRERMLEAQLRLMNLQPGETITTLAHAMGFSSSAAFSTLYRRQFGEAPSEVTRRNR